MEFAMVNWQIFGIIESGDSMRQKNYYEAYLDDYDKVIVFMSKNSYEGASNKFYMKDDQGHLFDLHIQSIETTQNNYNKYTLVLQDAIEIGVEYRVVHQHARSVVLEYCGIVKTKRFDEEFAYDGNDLGYTYDRTQTSFALWAPTASRVKLEVNKNNHTNTYEMKRTDKGVFRYTIMEDMENATYVYMVRVNGKWQESVDPYGNASIENTRRSAVVDMAKIRLHDVVLEKMNSACDAIIYETSVRDFTIQQGIGVRMSGKFRGFVEENEVTRQMCSGFSYLKTLGITHVQLMPVTDFGSVDENYPQMHYNWGYDPMQYRVLEGSYSIDPTNPYDRMIGFTKLVEECHRNGIRVNLDMVFNHVYDMETHAFEKTVPYYYFQMNANGDFSNGTYCGNDIDSTRVMCRKYILDACSFLVRTYHIDGFRLDLMGILDIDTVNAIYGVCSALRPDFMLYGEGWDMPSFLDPKQRASIANNAKMSYVAHFSDRFRDVVKGRTNTNEVSVKGYCTGATYLIDMMKNCLSASCISIGMDALFANPCHVINYVECHDNMTSWDKLKECCKEDSKEVRIQRAKMLMAAVLLAQGIPFLHSGQEFARSKHGLANTYEESDEINKLDYLRRNQYQDMVENAKDLIRIRKQHAVLRYATREEVEQHVSFADIDQKVLLYKIKDTQDDMVIIFNPTSEQFSYELEMEYPLIYYNGASQGKMIKTVDIAPYSTIVFSRQDVMDSE